MGGRWWGGVTIPDAGATGKVSQVSGLINRATVSG